MFQVDQPVQANTGVFSEFDSANQDHWFPGDLDMPQSVQGNFSEYDFANQDQWFAGDFNTQQLAPYSVPYGDESDMIWNYVVEENRDSLVDERFMQNFSEHRPKIPVTAVLADDSSDNDTDSMVSTLHITYHQNLFSLVFQFSLVDFWLLIDWQRHLELDW